jgi:NAD(P)-dependent dehydrogenase (short-subunit alcohol dehydrogenase family)
MKALFSLILKMPQDYLASEWDDVLNVNLRGAFLCSQAVYPVRIL